jgi:hypothetical protein
MGILAVTKSDSRGIYWIILSILESQELKGDIIKVTFEQNVLGL